MLGLPIRFRAFPRSAPPIFDSFIAFAFLFTFSVIFVSAANDSNAVFVFNFRRPICCLTQFVSYGTYLALTGRRVTGEEAINLGLATHFVHSSRIPVSQLRAEFFMSSSINLVRLFTIDSASSSFRQHPQLIPC
jgi:hypothetical protein